MLFNETTAMYSETVWNTRRANWRYIYVET